MFLLGLFIGMFLGLVITSIIVVGTLKEDDE